MRRAFLGSAAVAVLSLLVAPAAASAPSKPHTVYAHVIDASGAPLPGLAAADFGIIEAGQARKVTRVTMGGSPLRILLMVDSSDAISKIINPWRAALQAFLDAAPASDEIALVSMGRQMRIRVQPTADRKKLKDEAGRLFSDGGGTVLLDSLTEANDRLIARAEDRTPVLVVMTTDGSETSQATHEEEFNRFLYTMMARGAVVHAVVLGNGGTGTSGLVGGSSRTDGLQSVVALNLTQNTGGDMESIGAPTSLPDKLRAIGGMIAARHEKMKGWYQVDYVSDTPGPGRGLDVTVSRPDATIELTSQPPR